MARLKSSVKICPVVGATNEAKTRGSKTAQREKEGRFMVGELVIVCNS